MKNAKTTKKTAKHTTKQKIAKNVPTFTGTIAASKVYRREMPEFKNCSAECYLIINEVGQTYTFANIYNGQLKASYRPESYTYALTPKSQKKVTAKADTMQEVDVTDWPSWLTPATVAKRTRKTK